MPRELRTVGLEFFEEAPFRFTQVQAVGHPAARVFAAIADDPAGWGAWFPGFSRSGRYVSRSPEGTGSVREVTIGGLGYVETVIAWDAPRRWAFCVTRSGVPVARALAEDYQVEDDGDQALVSWTFAIEPRPAARLLVPVMKAALPGLFRRAMRNLNARLADATR